MIRIHNNTIIINNNIKEEIHKDIKEITKILINNMIMIIITIRISIITIGTIIDIMIKIDIIRTIEIIREKVKIIIIIKIMTKINKITNKMKKIFKILIKSNNNNKNL
jgi:hypothetical protein